MDRPPPGERPPEVAVEKHERLPRAFVDVVHSAMARDVRMGGEREEAAIRPGGRVHRHPALPVVR